MSSEIDTLYGFSDVCTGCRNLCTIEVTKPKNTYIYLPVINHKIVYDYIAHSPKNHGLLKTDFLDPYSLSSFNYDEFTETACFNPDEAFSMGKQITKICRRYKTR